MNHTSGVDRFDDPDPRIRKMEGVGKVAALRTRSNPSGFLSEIAGEAGVGVGSPARERMAVTFQAAESA